ncbi:Trafficking protein particle complex subunit 2-like protein [Sphaceloma murrayae]|uniref:Trafficking protein particle complex subunit 2-like protein n=1 Tax=Sphaceloma murrayae TaxID=2082308 RepID=A0A2K1QY77_9PEZI|nr:Trafficking protein particle complex subunit 2-like protein [Sphaceloma murrayae]
MAQRVPSIACIGIIGRHNNPLHIALFPADGEKEPRSKLEFSFMLSSCLDIFEARMPSKPVGQDFGLLQAIDERLAMYGWLTNTGVKFVIVIDMEGRSVEPQSAGRSATVIGLKNSDLNPVGSALFNMVPTFDTSQAFHAIHNAYINLLRNPFYMPDEHSPAHSTAQRSAGALDITSKTFIKEIDRVGRVWFLEGLNR